MNTFASRNRYREITTVQQSLIPQKTRAGTYKPRRQRSKRVGTAYQKQGYDNAVPLGTAKNAEKRSPHRLRFLLFTDIAKKQCFFRVQAFTIDYRICDRLGLVVSNTEQAYPFAKCLGGIEDA